MATTSYIDPATAWAAYALQDRTDESGSAVDDLNGEDMRIVLEAFTAGVLSTDAFQVREGSPTPGMTVRVGSGAAKSDVAILEGTEVGQGKYAVRLGDGVTDVTVPAADVSNPRIDEVYVVVQDDPYDSNGGNVVPRIGYRRGDAASSPSAPGPDGSWTAYLKLASINVAAGTTEIEAEDITDERVFSRLSVPPEDGSIDTVHLADQAVTTDKIATGAITSGRIADQAVTVSRIADGHVTAAKIAGDAISAFVRMAGTSGSPSLSTSDAQLLSTSVSIPTSWNTWSVVVMATGRYSISGSVSQVRLYLRVPGTGGDSPFFDYDFTPDGNSMPCALTFHRSGRTSTGTQTFSLRGSKSGSGTVSLVATTLSVIVVRES